MMLHSQRQLSIVADNGCLVEYGFDPAEAFPSFHVLFANGAPATLMNPFDHPWHCGLYFTWKYINDVNFWGDPQGPAGNVKIVTPILVAASDDQTEISHRCRWIDTRSTRVLMEEERRMTLVCPGSSCLRIDFDMTFTAMEAITLDRTPFGAETSWGGYAGMSVRLARNFAAGQLLNSSGAATVDAIHGQAADWCDFSAPVDAPRLKAATRSHEPMTAGVALFNHPGNPLHRSGFYVAKDGAMQFLQSSFVFHAPYGMEQGETLRLRYGILFHETALSCEQLAAYHDSYRSV